MAYKYYTTIQLLIYILHMDYIVEISEIALYNKNSLHIGGNMFASTLLHKSNLVGDPGEKYSKEISISKKTSEPHSKSSVHLETLLISRRVMGKKV